MASESENLNGKLEVNDSQLANIDIKENRKLRDAGLEYVSRTGKTIAAKVQPEELCNCPQRCGDKIPEEVRKYLFAEFYKMGDHIQQNGFLQKYIEMRSVRKRLWDDDEQRVGGRLQRRVSCKYHIPTEIPKTDSKDENAPVEKATSERKSNAKSAVNTVEVCQKAFMNTYAITEKRIRLQREKLISKSRKDAGMPSPNSKDSSQLWTHDLIAELGPLLMNREILANISSFENNTLPSDIPTKILLAIDNDISIVNNFFCDQLWKPEYIDFEYEKSLSLADMKDDHSKSMSLKNKSNGDPLGNGINSNFKYASADNSVPVSVPKTYTNPTVSSLKPYTNSTVSTPKPYTNSSAISTPKPYANSSTIKPYSNSSLVVTSSKRFRDHSTPKVNKNLSSDFSMTTSTPKNTGDSSRKSSSNGNFTSSPSSRYLSFENSSISITPVNSKSTSNSSSSIYNNINFGNSSISITPLYRQ